MGALVERIIAARDVLRARRRDFYSQDVMDVMADAANAIMERDELIAELLRHSVSHYGNPTDETFGVGLAHARARALLKAVA